LGAAGEWGNGEEPSGFWGETLFLAVFEVVLFTEPAFAVAFLAETAFAGVFFAAFLAEAAFAGVFFAVFLAGAAFDRAVAFLTAVFFFAGADFFALAALDDGLFTGFIRVREVFDVFFPADFAVFLVISSP
jgi:hypothetical protein